MNEDQLDFFKNYMLEDAKKYNSNVNLAINSEGHFESPITRLAWNAFQEGRRMQILENLSRRAA